jgi:hypothetical protein
MAKRKTRQQKIIADLRRQLSTTKIEPIKTHSISEKKVKIESIPQEKKAEVVSVKHLAYTSPYLTKDLRKTAILTAGIVLGQLFLFFLFRQHILILPGISY